MHEGLLNGAKRHETSRGLLKNLNASLVGSARVRRCVIRVNVVTLPRLRFKGPRSSSTRVSAVSRARDVTSHASHTFHTRELRLAGVARGLACARELFPDVGRRIRYPLSKGTEAESWQDECAAGTRGSTGPLLTPDVTTTMQHGQVPRASDRPKKIARAFHVYPFLTMEGMKQRGRKASMLRHRFALERHDSVSFPSLPLSPSRPPFWHLFTSPCSLGHSTLVRALIVNAHCTFCQTASSHGTVVGSRGWSARRVGTFDRPCKTDPEFAERNKPPRTQHPHSTIGNLRPRNRRDQITSAGESSAALRRNRESDERVKNGCAHRYYSEPDVESFSSRCVSSGTSFSACNFELGFATSYVYTCLAFVLCLTASVIFYTME